VAGLGKRVAPSAHALEEARKRFLPASGQWESVFLQICNPYFILLVVSFPFSLCVRLIGEDGAASEDHFLSNWNLVVDEKLGGSISASSAAAATHSAVVLTSIPHARPQKPASID